MRRVRRPLLALVVLLAAVAIGYAIDAAHSPGPSQPSEPPSVSTSR